jgi:hypothetical protein
LTTLFEEASSISYCGAYCGQNKRMVKKKKYGPLDLVSSESQTEPSDEDLAQVEARLWDAWYMSDAYLAWRALETQKEGYIEWFALASATWLEWWHVRAQSWAGCFYVQGPYGAPHGAPYDKNEVEYRLYVSYCENGDTFQATEAPVSPFREGEVDEKLEKKLFREWSKLK